MSGWLWLLVWAAFFYFMMRFGCGAHMVHGGHGAHEGHGGMGEREGGDKDPVCGMIAGPGQGYMKEYGGKVLHFCSRNCLDKFEAEPQRYASKKG